MECIINIQTRIRVIAFIIAFTHTSTTQEYKKSCKPAVSDTTGRPSPPRPRPRQPRLPLPRPPWPRPDPVCNVVGRTATEASASLLPPRPRPPRPRPPRSRSPRSRPPRLRPDPVFTEVAPSYPPPRTSSLVRPSLAIAPAVFSTTKSLKRSGT